MSKKSDRYLVEAPYVADRVDQKVYDRVHKQTAKWTPLASRFPTKNSSVMGNIGMSLVYDTEKEKLVFKEHEFNGKYVSLCRAISSALLLYRLLSLFKATVETEGPEGYKCTWWVTLKHNETGEQLTLGEWKGAAEIFTKFHSLEELPESFREDLLLLMNELVSPDCPHPYDGCVSGSVA